MTILQAAEHSMSTSIPVSTLIGFCSPFDYNVWGCGVVSITDIQRAIDDGQRLDHEQWAILKNAAGANPLTVDQHAQRIAYLIDANWTQPIEIDVGVPRLGCTPSWIYEDGNHRLCAAVMRNDSAIQVNISGDVDYAESIFGVKVELLPTVMIG
jgi:hypothetical protein